MNNFMEVIKDRRSIRRYQERELPEDLLDHVLEAVQWSPSWANTQCWEVVVVKDPQTKQEIQEKMGKGNPATKAIMEAPIILAICGKLHSSGYYKDEVATKFGDWFMFDLGLATQSLCLTAHHLGLGTVIVGLFDHDGVKEILHIPDGYELVVLIPLGFPARESGAPKRRDVTAFTHFGAF